MSSHPSLRDDCQLTAAEEKVAIFFSDVSTVKWLVHQYMTSHPFSSQ